MCHMIILWPVAWVRDLTATIFGWAIRDELGWAEMCVQNSALLDNRCSVQWNVIKFHCLVKFFSLLPGLSPASGYKSKFECSISKNFLGKKWIDVELLLQLATRGKAEEKALACILQYTIINSFTAFSLWILYRKLSISLGKRKVKDVAKPEVDSVSGTCCPWPLLLLIMWRGRIIFTP